MTTRSLIVKLGAIGDVAMVLPAARRLYESGSEIDWLCGKSVEPLLACYSWVQPIVVDDARLLGGRRIEAALEMLRTWQTMLGASYDFCAVLHYHIAYKMLILSVRSRRTVVLDWNRREFCLVSERHHSAEYARILCDAPDDYRTENVAPLAPDLPPENPLPRKEQTRIALVPGGARNILRDNPVRRWPLESYVALSKLLTERGYEVVLTGGPGDAWVESVFAGLPVDNRIGQWSIPETVVFYNSCDCVITHDTGPLHLAGLSSCALLGLFGPTEPSKFLPRRKNVTGFWGGKRLACRPCYNGQEYANCAQNKCLISISPQRVIAEVEVLLANVDADWRVECI